MHALTMVGTAQGAFAHPTNKKGAPGKKAGRAFFYLADALMSNT
jgi:hypothetical protein